MQHYPLLHSSLCYIEEITELEGAGIRSPGSISSLVVCACACTLPAGSNDHGDGADGYSIPKITWKLNYTQLVPLKESSYEDQVAIKVINFQGIPKGSKERKKTNPRCEVNALNIYLTGFVQGRMEVEIVKKGALVKSCSPGSKPIVNYINGTWRRSTSRSVIVLGT
ncbi:unnamed protein product [Allacma fusca]|uniref:Uncharacterized protein n=1 Tax=Allacma fusca TaxID=39272 RepID=A0A8J2PXP2_9HEXA|nr:unnamed protein product [Allacma fusca]